MWRKKRRGVQFQLSGEWADRCALIRLQTKRLGSGRPRIWKSVPSEQTWGVRLASSSQKCRSNQPTAVGVRALAVRSTRASACIVNSFVASITARWRVAASLGHRLTIPRPSVAPVVVIPSHEPLGSDCVVERSSNPLDSYRLAATNKESCCGATISRRKRETQGRLVGVGYCWSVLLVSTRHIGYVQVDLRICSLHG